MTRPPAPGTAALVVLLLIAAVAVTILWKQTAGTIALVLLATGVWAASTRNELRRLREQHRGEVVELPDHSLRPKGAARLENVDALSDSLGIGGDSGGTGS